MYLSFIGVASIVSGGALFCQKSWRPFLVVALKDCLNIPQNLSHVAKTVLKIDSCSGWGCTSCPGGCTYTFPCKLGLKKIFSPPWGVQVHPLHLLATPMLSFIRGDRSITAVLTVTDSCLVSLLDLLFSLEGDGCSGILLGPYPQQRTQEPVLANREFRVCPAEKSNAAAAAAAAISTSDKSRSNYCGCERPVTFHM